MLHFDMPPSSGMVWVAECALSRAGGQGIEGWSALALGRDGERSLERGRHLDEKRFLETNTEHKTREVQKDRTYRLHT